jgi:hypothetical protein
MDHHDYAFPTAGLDATALPSDPRVSVVNAEVFGDGVLHWLKGSGEVIRVEPSDHIGSEGDCDFNACANACFASMLRLRTLVQCSRLFAVDLGTQSTHSGEKVRVEFSHVFTDVE